MRNKIYALTFIVFLIILLAAIVTQKIKEEKDMAVIYAALIIKGVKTITDVPMCIRDKVKKVLIDLDVPELAEE